jgi:hypothetical protein
MVFAVFTASTKNKNKNAKIEFRSGNCEMCKKRIEKEVFQE